jgi:hypothetical protein
VKILWRGGRVVEFDREAKSEEFLWSLRTGIAIVGRAMTLGYLVENVGH